jgi:hypothetical protein
MLRTTALLFLLAAAARADDPAKKDTYPKDQQGTVDRLERVKSAQAAAKNPRNAAVLPQAIDRLREEVKDFRTYLSKKLTTDGLQDWSGTVKSVTEQNVSFEVGPGLTLRVSRAGMDGPTRGVIKSLGTDDPVTINVSPVLLADVIGEPPNLVAVVGGKYLTVQRGKPKP